MQNACGLYDAAMPRPTNILLDTHLRAAAQRLAAERGLSVRLHPGTDPR